MKHVGSVTIPAFGAFTDLPTRKSALIVGFCCEFIQATLYCIVLQSAPMSGPFKLVAGCRHWRRSQTGMGSQKEPGGPVKRATQHRQAACGHCEPVKTIGGGGGIGSGGGDGGLGRTAYAGHMVLPAGGPRARQTLPSHTHALTPLLSSE